MMTQTESRVTIIIRTVCTPNQIGTRPGPGRGPATAAYSLEVKLSRSESVEMAT